MSYGGEFSNVFKKNQKNGTELQHSSQNVNQMQCLFPRHSLHNLVERRNKYS